MAMNCPATADTQPTTESQRSTVWTQLESQPIENIVWGRLYAKKTSIKSLDLYRPEYKAGRDTANALCITDKEVPRKILSRISKTHFKIIKDLDEPSNPVYIVDNSQNGTYLNKELIGRHQRRIIRNNDSIALSHPDYTMYVYKDLSPDDTKGLPNEIVTSYHISKKLGSGACGVVKLIYDTKSCLPYAMKHVEKNVLAECSKPKHLNDPQRVMNEVHIMTTLEHPCVIKMHDIVDKPDSVYMVLELMKGGDLLTRIIKSKHLSEKTSKLFFFQMCHAVQYLHRQGITHRDLKPDNVLLENNDEETLIKVSDFGLSKFVHKDSVMRTLCGTPLYVAPEVLLTKGRESYTRRVDIWSLGVVLYTMLSGSLPFSDEYGSPATEQIKKGKFAFKHRAWKQVSSVAKKLIMEILTVDPNKRPSISDILNHRWMRDDAMIRKAKSLMKISLTPERNISDIENNDKLFAEPPSKRQRTK